MRSRAASLVRRFVPRARVRALVGTPLAFGLRIAASWTAALLLAAGTAFAEEAPRDAVPDPAVGEAPTPAPASDPAPDATPGRVVPRVAAPRGGDDRALEIIEDVSGGSGGEPAGLKRKARKAERVRAKEREARREAAEAPPRWADPVPGWGGYPWSWGWYPWYGIPQTQPQREYPPSITHIPRLGLQYNYPWAYQMGIRIPDDSDPLNHPPTLGPFVGVVQAAKEELRRAEEAAAEAAPNLLDTGLALLEAGEYGNAGRVLLAGFETSDDPEYPVLLTEVFFALGKPSHAEALLRHALRMRRGLKALPDDVGAHFPSQDVFAAKLGALLEAGTQRLLAGYLLLSSDTPERGIEMLRSLASEKPDDEEAGILYRHSLRLLLPR